VVERAVAIAEATGVDLFDTVGARINLADTDAFATCP